MNRTTLTRVMIAAGTLAVTGFAQAQYTTDVPAQAGEASTMTGGAPNAKSTNSPYTDNGVLVLNGTPHVTTQTYVYRSPVYTYSYPVAPAPYVYVYPAPHAYSAPVVTYPYGVTTYSYVAPSLPAGSASSTSNVPDRAGEASTFTGGAPNAVTNNNTVIGSTFVPYYDRYGRVYIN